MKVKFFKSNVSFFPDLEKEVNLFLEYLEKAGQGLDQYRGTDHRGECIDLSVL